MLETPHVLIGAAIATKVGNPYLALPLAFLSHFVVEKIPHWNPHLNAEKKKYGHPTKKTTIIVAFDSTVALVLGSYLSYRVLPNTNLALTTFFACFLAVLPDVIEAPYFFLGINHNIFQQKWIKFQKSLQNDAPLIPGLLTQLVIGVLSWWWIMH